MTGWRVFAWMALGIVVAVLTLPRWGLLVLDGYNTSDSWRRRSTEAQLKVEEQQARIVVLLHPLVTSRTPPSGFMLDISPDDRRRATQFRFHFRAVNRAEQSMYAFAAISRSEKKVEIRLTCIVPLPIIDLEEENTVSPYARDRNCSHPTAVKP